MSPAMEVQQMIEQLDQFQLPASLMESFDAYREESVKAVTDGFSHSQMAWFQDLMNRFRGPDDRKDSLLDIFDPCMFTTEHPAWDAEPGTSIELPPLTSEVAIFAGSDEEFTNLHGRNSRVFVSMQTRMTMVASMCPILPASVSN